VGRFVDQSGIGIAQRNTLRLLAKAGVEVTNDPREPYDLLHVQFIGPRAWVEAGRARKRGIPVVLTVHTSPDLVPGSFTCAGAIAPLYEACLRQFIRRVDLLLAPSPYVAEMIRPIAGGRPVRVASGAVDVERFRFRAESRVAFREEFRLERPTVLAVGQLIPRKGVATFFEAARTLSDVQFLWAGPRPNRFLLFSPRFDRLLRSCPENVRLVGFLPEIERAYSGCDALLHAAHAETLGLVLLEASASGLPIVARRLPVYGSWFQEGRDGRLASTDEEFVQELRGALAGPAPRAIGDVAHRFDFPRAAEALLAAYQEVL
jgi:glycosyltransferase involved in cell wall biosynthesis